MLVEDGGLLFVAGKSKFMPKSVEKAVTESIENHYGSGEAIVKLLKKQRLYIVEGC